VLLLGETGTGKELIARAHSSIGAAARTGNLVKLNWRSDPTDCWKANCFGHEPEAFTGAIAQKVGRVELAGPRLVVPGRIGDIPLEATTKLLVVLQGAEFSGFGQHADQKVDVRVVAADASRLGRDGRRKAVSQRSLLPAEPFPHPRSAFARTSRDIPLARAAFVSRRQRK